MTERRAIGLIMLGGLLLSALLLTGLFALGVPGTGLSLGAIIPLMLTSYATSRVVMHYGESDHRR